MDTGIYWRTRQNPPAEGTHVVGGYMPQIVNTLDLMPYGQLLERMPIERPRQWQLTLKPQRSGGQGKSLRLAWDASRDPVPKVVKSDNFFV